MTDRYPSLERLRQVARDRARRRQSGAGESEIPSGTRPRVVAQDTIPTPPLGVGHLAISRAQWIVIAMMATGLVASLGLAAARNPLAPLFLGILLVVVLPEWPRWSLENPVVLLLGAVGLGIFFGLVGGANAAIIVLGVFAVHAWLRYQHHQFQATSWGALALTMVALLTFSLTRAPASSPNAPFTNTTTSDTQSAVNTQTSTTKPTNTTPKQKPKVPPKKKHRSTAKTKTHTTTRSTRSTTPRTTTHAPVHTTQTVSRPVPVITVQSQP